MQKKTNKVPAQVTIDSLEALNTYKEQLRGELDIREERVADIWQEMFRQPTQEELNSPTKRLVSTIASASALIDGALLGWKLYRRLGGTVSLFRKKRK
jgi:hypothetical protein